MPKWETISQKNKRKCCSSKRLPSNPSPEHDYEKWRTSHNRHSANALKVFIFLQLSSNMFRHYGRYKSNAQHPYWREFADYMFRGLLDNWANPYGIIRISWEIPNLPGFSAYKCWEIHPRIWLWLIANEFAPAARAEHGPCRSERREATCRGEFIRPNPASGE